jgi:hypothetical protein
MYNAGTRPPKRRRMHAPFVWLGVIKMTDLNRNDEVAQLLQVIEDALRSLRRGHTTAAAATLHNAIEKKRIGDDCKEPRIIYFR